VTDFPTRPEELGPGELTHYLRAAGVLAGGRVTGARFELIGTGKMGDVTFTGSLISATRFASS
jgi:hypothetical protein